MEQHPTETNDEVSSHPSRSSSLAIFQGALGDALVCEPAVRALARRGPVDAWGFSPERLAPLVAPRGPLRAASGVPQDASALWGDGPLAPTQAEWARRACAFGDHGPLAAQLQRHGGVAVPFPPGGGVPLPGHAGDLVLAAVCEALGLPRPLPAVPTLRARPRDVERGRGLLRAPVVVHVGSGGRGKRYPAWKEALQGIPATWVAGPVEVECGDAPPDAVLSTSIDDLLGICAAASVFLGNDSGPSHLAAALGTPTIAVFGPTDPACWGPRGLGPVRCLGGRGHFPDPREVRQTLVAWIEAGGGVPGEETVS